MSGRISSIRLSPDILASLSSMAKRRDRSVNYLVGLAVKRMLSEDEKLLETVKAGIAQLDAGLGIPHHEMLHRSQTIIDKALAKQSV